MKEQTLQEAAKEVTMHDLKTIQPYFNDLYAGKKVFELRKDDRDFNVGDWCNCREYDPETNTYSGKAIKAEISYILRDAPQFGLANGYCILSFGSNVSFDNSSQQEPVKGVEELEGEFYFNFSNGRFHVDDGDISGRKIFNFFLPHLTTNNQQSEAELTLFGEFIVNNHISTDPIHNKKFDIKKAVKEFIDIQTEQKGINQDKK